MAQDDKWHITVVSEFSGKIWSSLSQRSNSTEIFHKFFEIPKPVFLQFELTSIPWGENSSPLVATLQSMVKSILNQNEMSSPSANEHRKLSVEQRIDQMKIQLDDKTK